jgi:hypothetical protein
MRTYPGARNPNWRGGLDRYVPEPNTGCWLWLGAAVNKWGHGTITIGGRQVLAHRAMYEREVGPIPTGMTLDHLCRIPACINPAHLEPVTLLENIRRGAGASVRNAKKTHCISGHPFDERNTHVTVLGARACRMCAAARARQARRDRRGGS